MASFPSMVGRTSQEVRRLGSRVKEINTDREKACWSIALIAWNFWADVETLSAVSEF